MKTKNVFLSVVILLMSISLSASVEHLSMTGVQDGAYFYYCTTVDSVIVHKPEGAGLPVWYHEGLGYIETDSIIITHDLAGVWQWDGSIEFTITFTTIAPTPDPFASEELYKCPETSMVILGQAEHQPDFTYLWGGGETTPSIELLIPGMVFVTITGACGEVSDMMEVMNWPSPNPSLGADQFLCNGSTATLDPGDFAAYFWTGGSTDPTLGVTTTGTYEVTVADDNGCQETDDVFIEFTTNPGQGILLVTIDSISGNNRVTWETDDSQFVMTRVWRKLTGDTYEEVGYVEYTDGGFTDDVSSVQQTWNYKISMVDTCGNESPKSLYHTTISAVTLYIAGGGYSVEWTPYVIEGEVEKGTKSVSFYYVFAVDGLGVNWDVTELTQVAEDVFQYNLPNTDDSMFVVGAELSTGTKSGINGLAMSNLVNNPILAVPSILAEDIKIYPNPSNGVFFVEGGKRIEVYNSLGQLVMSDQIQELTTIKLPASTGVYFVKVYDQRSQVIVSKKITIQ